MKKCAKKQGKMGFLRTLDTPRKKIERAKFISSGSLFFILMQQALENKGFHPRPF